MISWWNKTVTLYRYTETTGSDGRHHVSYIRSVVNNCSWSKKYSKAMQADSTSVHRLRIICRMPAGLFEPHPGDYMFLGSVIVENPNAKTLNAFIEADRTGCKVTSVSDNTLDGVLPHWHMEGDAV